MKPHLNIPKKKVNIPLLQLINDDLYEFFGFYT